jgi:hypothetical protein
MAPVMVAVRRAARLPLLGLIATVVLWPATGQPAAAAAFSLSDGEQQAAIRAGQRSLADAAFGAEWTQRDESGQALTVMTPFHRLALAARNAAFRGSTLSPKDVTSALKGSERGLELWVTLRGDRPDFARLYVPALLGTRTADVKPRFVQNERTALRDEDGRYTARCQYVFPAEAVNGSGRVTLVVRDGEEREKAKFTVDLAAMR